MYTVLDENAPEVLDEDASDIQPDQQPLPVVPPVAKKPRVVQLLNEAAATFPRPVVPPANPQTVPR